MKSLHTLAAALMAAMLPAPKAQFRGRRRTADAAFTFRMGAGFPGDVNRTHPASIEPLLLDADDPPSVYGQAGILDSVTHGLKKFTAGDTAVDTIWAAIVRPYPQQQASATNFGAVALGNATPPAGIADGLRSGYIMGQLNDVSATPSKGDPVFIWCAADSGIHKQGGYEVAASGGNTAALDPKKYSFNGGADSAGVVELCINV